MVGVGGERIIDMYQTEAMQGVVLALSREIVKAFQGGSRLSAVYCVASRAAPRLYPPREKMTAHDLERVTDLLTDAFLILKDGGKT